MKKVQIGFGVDIDAVSGWLGSYGGEDSLSDISRGLQAGEVNVGRLLKMFAKYNMTQTFYIPGHSLETFPKECAAVRDAGHEIGLHGYSHEEPNKLSADQQRDVFNHTYRLLADFLGDLPKGIVSPMCQVSAESAQIFLDNGLEYDHSAMHRDCVPYYLRVDDEWTKMDLDQPASAWMKPLVRGRTTDLVEIPMNWFQDDWIPFTYARQVPNCGGWTDPEVVIKIWQERFHYFYREYDYFIFPICIHPDASGHPHVILALERFIEWINTHEGVEWVPIYQMARTFKEKYPTKEMWLQAEEANGTTV